MTQFNATPYEIERMTGRCAFTGRPLAPGESYIATLVEVAASSEGDRADDRSDAADAQAAPAQPTAPQGTDDDGQREKTQDAPGSDDAAQAGRGKKGNADSDTEKASSQAADLGLRRVDVSLEAWEQGKRPERLFSYWRSTAPTPNEKKKVFVDDGVLMNLFLRLGDSGQEQRQAFRFVLGLILMRKKLLRYDRTEKRVIGPADGQAASSTNADRTEQDQPGERTDAGASGEPGDGGAAGASAATPEPVTQEWWWLTPKVDVTKGPMGKWDESQPVDMLDPHLDEEQAAQVGEQLNEILSGEWS